MPGTRGLTAGPQSLLCGLTEAVSPLWTSVFSSLNWEQGCLPCKVTGRVSWDGGIPPGTALAPRGALSVWGVGASGGGQGLSALGMAWLWLVPPALAGPLQGKLPTSPSLAGTALGLPPPGSLPKCPVGMDRFPGFGRSTLCLSPGTLELPPAGFLRLQSHLLLSIFQSRV